MTPGKYEEGNNAISYQAFDEIVYQDKDTIVAVFKDSSLKTGEDRWVKTFHFVNDDLMWSYLDGESTGTVHYRKYHRRVSFDD